MSLTFLKWAGGKNWFVNRENTIFPQRFETYYEPFLGSGAMFFYLHPERAVLSDVNKELIDTFIAIRDDCDVVYKNLAIHAKRHNSDYYYEIRKRKTRTIATSAARMIYLNRTCYNGIYRVNSKGEFNVPIGSEEIVSFSKEKFEQASKLLLRADIQYNDFETSINLAKKDDFIFCDPPYVVHGEYCRFVGYTQETFSWNDQLRLASALIRAKERGVKILMTNVNHITVRHLYENKGFELSTVDRSCTIAATPDGRKKYQELIVSANL